MANGMFLSLSSALYAAARPLIFRQSAQAAHEQILTVLSGFDQHPALLHRIYRSAFNPQAVEVGGVKFDQ
jgi:hypothetical protein